MRKIIPFGIVALIVIGVSAFLLVSRSATTPYNATNPASYNTIPSPATTNLSLYTNDKYRFTLEYPKVGLDHQNNLIDCGKFISENNTLFAPDNSLIIDNIAIIEVAAWSKSIEDYISSQGAAGIYNTSKILSSGADDGVKIDGLKTPWSGEGYAPLGYVSDIYQRDGKLFLVQNQQNFMNDGCIAPKDLSAAPSSVDRTWRIEDHLRFY